MRKISPGLGSGPPGFLPDALEEQLDWQLAAEPLTVPRFQPPTGTSYPSQEAGSSGLPTGSKHDLATSKHNVS